MAPITIRKALGAVKDQTSINLAKVGTGSCTISDLDVAIVKATSHDEFPADEKHVKEILSLTCYSRARISSCVGALSRRLCKTRNWTVALKALVLVQRLLADGDPAYEEEIFFTTRRGTRLLNLSDFRDSSRSRPWDYSAFVRTYALYLDEQLEYRMQGRLGKRARYGHEEENQEDTVAPPVGKATPTRELKIEQLFSKMHRLQRILERFLACRPTGGARDNRIVFIALYPIVKESFHIYYNIAEVKGVLVERFMGLDIANCVKVYELFVRLGKQLEELDIFYCWCKNAGVARSTDYPDIEKVTQERLDEMDEFIRGKSALARGRRETSGSVVEHVEETPAPESPKEPEEEKDVNEIKPLPSPEEKEVPLKEDPEPKHVETKWNVQEEAEAGLLNFGKEAPTSQEHGDKLALALFDGGAQPATTASPWEAYKMADWEAALVGSASNLSSQNMALGGGFDVLLLNGMYQHGLMNAGIAVVQGVSGSASSARALGSAGGGDPFAASVGVAAPSYVQMSEMEGKQRMMMEEKLMWEKYAMQQGHVHVNSSSFSYNMGAYYQPANF